MRQPNIRCAGEEFIPSVGVFLQFSKERKNSESDSLAFLIRVLAVFTAFSTLPLLCGYPGELVMCSVPDDLRKLLNSAELSAVHCHCATDLGFHARQSETSTC